MYLLNKIKQAWESEDKWLTLPQLCLAWGLIIAITIFCLVSK